MTQHELLLAFVEALNALGGHHYVVDYAPFRNLSEQTRREIYYCVSPGRMEKKKINFGSLVTRQEVIVMHVGIIPGESDAGIIASQNEIDAILEHFTKRGGPLQEAGVSCVANESRPPVDSGVFLDGLTQSPRTLVAQVSIMTER